MGRNHLKELLELGHTLSNLKKYEEAAWCFSNAQYLDPDNYIISFNLGNTFLNFSQYCQAAEAYSRTIILNPTFAAAYANLGIALRGQGKNFEAIEAYDKSLTLENNPETCRNKAIALLATGNLPEGFRLYEERLKIEEHNLLYKWYSNGKPYWKGEIFSGKRLLVHHEQGFGDSLQYVRYLKKVKECGGTVILSAPKPLLPLYENCAAVGAIDILIEHEHQSVTNTPYDLVVPLMSLPYIFGITLKTIPADIPYITADPELTFTWREKILKKDGNRGNLRVGLVWAAGNTNADGLTKAFKLADMSPLANIKGVTYFSLQIGAAAQEVQNLPDNMNFFDLTEDICNFADTAALIANFDLIISVDTSVAHLAGAMGKKSWTLLRYNSGWMWFSDREDSPWYPTMRLFRQPSPGDWASVIGQVEISLRNLVSQHNY